MIELLSKIWFSLLCAACLAGGTLLWTVQTWAAPHMPLVICGVGAAAIIGIAVRSRRGQPQSEVANAQVEPHGSMGFEGPLALHIIPLALGVVLCGSWLFSPVRQQAVAFASSINLLSVQSMQADPEISVRATACRELLRNGNPSQRDSLLEVFHESTDLRERCLQPALEAKIPLARWVAQNVAQRWRRDLMSPIGAVSEQRACEIATHLAGLARPADRLQLLRQSLASSSETTRRCFTQALGDVSDLSKIVGDPAAVTDEMADALLDPLAQRVFFDPSLINKAWSSPDNQRWVWRLACDVAGEGRSARNRTGAEVLKSITYHLSCDWSPGTSAASFETLNWARVCQSLRQPLAASPEADSLCPALTPHLVNAAVEYAKGMVAVGLSKYTMRVAAVDISSTPVGAGRGPTEEEKAAAKIFSMNPEELFGKDNYPKRSGCREIMMAMFPGDERFAAADAFARMGGAKIDCANLSANSTVGEAYKRLNEVRNGEELEFDSLFDRRYLEKTHGTAAVNSTLRRMERIRRE
jgi:hypothetical protein